MYILKAIENSRLRWLYYKYTRRKVGNDLSVYRWGIVTLVKGTFGAGIMDVDAVLEKVRLRVSHFLIFGLSTYLVS